MKKLILPLLIATISFSHTLNAEIYKWTDKEGKIHYSSTPPKEDPKQAQEIGDKIKANIGKVQPATSYKKTSTTDEAKKSQKKAEEPYKNDRSPARIKYCNNLKKNIATLKNEKNVNLVEKGKPSALSDEQKSKHLKKSQSNLEKNCKDI